jgi:UPF0755 protein
VLKRVLWLVVVLAGAAIVAGAWIHLRANAALVLEAPRVVEVRPGIGVQALAYELEAQGVLDDAGDLRWAARLYGRGPIRAGEYRVEPGITAREFLERLERGAVLLHALTVIEGSTYAELRAKLARHPAIRQTLAGISDGELMARLGAPGRHPEGQFLPDTYLFPRGTSDLEFLRRAHAALERELAAAWETRRSDLSLDTPYAALTLASIVEKETAVAAERTTIAGVFARRLARGMRLQTDPTVIYGMGARYQGNIRKRDLQTDTPYNTYTRAGLPPTPICLPGAASIRAATRPAPGDALYFVATGDGGHAFSATLDEHNAALRRYLAKLRANKRNGQ